MQDGMLLLVSAGRDLARSVGLFAQKSQGRKEKRCSRKRKEAESRKKKEGLQEVLMGKAVKPVANAASFQTRKASNQRTGSCRALRRNWPTLMLPLLHPVWTLKTIPASCARSFLASTTFTNRLGKLGKRGMNQLLFFYVLKY